MVKLSIIIPVYNGEEYIDRCFRVNIFGLWIVTIG